MMKKTFNNKFQVKKNPTNKKLEAKHHVRLHPTSIRLIEQGHFWIINDGYTKNFPQKKTWLVGVDHAGKKNCLFFHDPEHSQVKGRVWKHTIGKEEYNSQNFSHDLEERLVDAFQKRCNATHWSERDNCYLVFGEADNLPGLLIQKIGNHLLIQFYSGFWRKQYSVFISKLRKALLAVFPDSEWNVWIQKRDDLRKANIERLWGDETISKDWITEFGVKYRIQFQEYYDIGIYSDMSSIRKQLSSHFKKCTHFLNLYAYTGAFSLFALKNQAQAVTSVDISSAYIQWLEENLRNNPDLDESKHCSVVSPVQKAVVQFIQEEKEFDFILCDPPSASSDGKKIKSALQVYETLLPQLIQVCSKRGKILVFLNTHKVKLKDFQRKIETILNEQSRKVKVIQQIGLGEDCPVVEGFEDGNYLKGLLLQAE
ncbi:MAG: 23S rRNA (cytosine1962-C5)-methyltransferase [bacterium]|jgi:23S rRNA (cytosine1962-C5)-methyltransferase